MPRRSSSPELTHKPKADQFQHLLIVVTSTPPSVPVRPLVPMFGRSRRYALPAKRLWATVEAVRLRQMARGLLQFSGITSFEDCQPLPIIMGCLPLSHYGVLLPDKKATSPRSLFSGHIVQTGPSDLCRLYGQRKPINPSTGEIEFDPCRYILPTRHP